LFGGKIVPPREPEKIRNGGGVGGVPNRPPPPPVWSGRLSWRPRNGQIVLCPVGPVKAGKAGAPQIPYFNQVRPGGRGSFGVWENPPEGPGFLEKHTEKTATRPPPCNFVARKWAFKKKTPSF